MTTDPAKRLLRSFGSDAIAYGHNSGNTPSLCPKRAGPSANKQAVRATSASLHEFSSLEIEPLIAPKPAEPADSSRLLVLNRASASMSHLVFRELPSLLGPNDLLVLNRSRVWKAKLPAEKPTGGKTDLLLIAPQRPDMTIWTALARKIKAGQRLVCGAGVNAVCAGLNPDGSWTFEFSSPVNEAYLTEHGQVPLPQYILKARKRKSCGNAEFAADEARYQTVFADAPGSIAAPTAGFHFTPAVFAALEARGARVAFVTLHIGWGTFRPVRCKNPADHVMLEETCFLDSGTASMINAHKKSGGRVIAVGTSSMRTLETFAGTDGRLIHGERRAGLFIRPGYKFKVAGAFITNLHVPDSAPLYMTAAFAGREPLFKAYTEAVREKYRFYSYGDSMLIL
ncbi:MAG: tRNA preQ1(34) S-adenosylmethionine ribosyltransferase-isomerase QueA [Elusimicrobia bacterium]|nr:tRNA preQ1(34) S-adenosylmethionine ribosyltransferase-isomerase QueA [Elusimicrobiota bacterium]